MGQKITPELSAAWRTLQSFAAQNRHAISMVGVNAAEEVAKAIDVIDNSDFMVPVEEAGDADVTGEDRHLNHQH
jgi:hypothetical protein